MFLKVVSAAVLATVCFTFGAQAQSVADIGGPANLPPAGFKGQQFVDKRGCVFLKAGLGGQTNWVPRVGRNRKALCGYPPSFAKPPEVVENQVAAPAPAQVAAAAPVARAPVAAAPVMRAPRVAVAAAEPAPSTYVPAVVAVAAPVVVARQPAPYAQTAPQSGYEVVSGQGVAGKIGCYTSAPVAERVKLTSGGTAVVCTRGDGTMNGWRPPIYPVGARVGAALSDPVGVARADRGGAAGYVADYAAAVPRAAAPVAAVPTPPAGYVLAWDDDRLNPNRGRGTAQGWADQDQVWTREVPARLVADVPKAKRKKALLAEPVGSRVTVSTKNSATAPIVAAKAAGRSYVQVGTFGVSSNADGAASRLRALGLPVSRSKITSGGKAMQIVLAGPFASAADARAALSMARGAGFGDAILR